MNVGRVAISLLNKIAASIAGEIMLGGAATAVTVGVAVVGVVDGVAAAVTVTFGGVLDVVAVAGEDVLDGDADAVTVGGVLDRAGTAVAVAGASIAGEGMLGGAAVWGVLDPLCQ